MKTQLFLLLISLFLINACTSTYVIKQEQNDLEEFNDQLQGQTATIKLDNDNIVEGEEIVLFPDSVFWIESESQKRYYVHSSTVQDICVSNPSRGGTTGFWIGMAAGAAFGVKEVSSEGYGWLNTVEAGVSKIMGLDESGNSARYITGIAIGGLAGGLVGVTIGAIIGSTDRYIFDQDTQSVKIVDESFVSVKFSSIVKKDSRYIIILWQNMEIRLERTEYKYRGTTMSGQPYIVVPINVYENKFK